MQKRNKDEVMVKVQRGNKKGEVTHDTGWVVIQVGSAALKLAQAMKKEVRELTPRMQKFREAIQTFNVTKSFVKGAHNLISDTLLRSPVGGAEQVEAVLRRLRGHASYAYNRVVSCIKGDICKEVIEDPALDDMLKAARLDKG